MHQHFDASRIVVLALSLLLSLPAQSQSLRVEPEEVEVGDSILVTWASDSASVFVTGIGLLPGSGSIRIRPSRSITYWMVTGAEGRPALTSAAVKVTGRRDLEIPPPDDFPRGQRREARNVHYIVLLDAIDAALHEVWGTSPLWFHNPHDTFTRAVTQRMPRSELLGPMEPSLGARRVAFMVTAFEPSAERGESAAYELSAKVESRLRNDSRFEETEQDSAVARALIDRLGRQIQKALGARPQ